MNSHIFPSEYDFSHTHVPRVRLVDHPERSFQSLSFDGLAAALVSNHEALDNEAPFSLLGGPGTGKTSLLIEAAVSHLARGGSADEIMVVTPSKEAAESFRRAAFERLAQEENLASSGSFVRSIHSWAFALYRAVTTAEEQSAPRLLTGAEHDMQIRELLRGIAEAPGEYNIDWPQELIPALTYVGFARQLRDVLLRANERGLGGAELEALGREHSRPVWTAAGQFLTHFEETRRLSEVEDLNASELLHAAVAALDTEAGGQLLEQRRAQLKLILVDDAHNLDPAAARLIEHFITPQARTIIAGDPDQCVFHFRGADEQFLTRYAKNDERRVVLSLSHRLGEDHVRAVTGLQQKLPANTLTRQPLRAARQATKPTESGELLVRIAANQTTERLFVADQVRRAHIERDIDWRDIAVIVRSTGQIPALRRTLMNHGVPVRIDSTSIVLSEQAVVRQLLLILESATRTLHPSEVRLVMESSLGGVTPVMMRQIERAIALILRAEKAAGRELFSYEDGTPWRAMDYLCRYVQGDQELEWISARFTPRVQSLTQHIAGLFAAAREAQAEKDRSVEKTLWKVWQYTGLDRALQQQALRGGTEGAQAEQNLDAVMNLFDLAGNFAENSPLGDLRTFIEEVRSQELPTGHRSRVSMGQDSVEILPAHATVGREWVFTVVSGVQEGEWPTGPTVGGVFGQSELVDLIDHQITPGTAISRLAEAIQEERRLFLLAISRASEQTVVTAVSQPDADALMPSRFLGEIPVRAAELMEVAQAEQPFYQLLEEMPRVLSRESLVAELRDAVQDQARPAHERQAAARNLAKLALHGVPEAHPKTWWGTLEPSSTTPVVKTDKDGKATVRLSPSQLKALEDNPLAWFFSQHRGVQDSTVAMRRGSLFHAIAEAYTRGMPMDDGVNFMEKVLPLLEDGPRWGAAETIRKWGEALPILHRWLEESFGEEATLGRSERITVEKKLSAEAGHISADGEDIAVILSGRTDLIDSTEDGSVVYDFKTSANPISEADAAESLQLSAYQYLIERQGGTAAGAKLVYPMKPVKNKFTKEKEPNIREQGSATPDTLAAFEEKLAQLAELAIGPEYSFEVDLDEDDTLIQYLIDTTVTIGRNADTEQES